MDHFHISLGLGCKLLAMIINWPVDESADQIGEGKRGSTGGNGSRLAFKKFLVQVSQVSNVSTTVVRRHEASSVDGRMCGRAFGSKQTELRQSCNVKHLFEVPKCFDQLKHHIWGLVVQ
jgi:hypothetical protein